VFFRSKKQSDHTIVGIQLTEVNTTLVRHSNQVDINQIRKHDSITDEQSHCIYAGSAITLEHFKQALGNELDERFRVLGTGIHYTYR
jgi:hypothetical protein